MLQAYFFITQANQSSRMIINKKTVQMQLFEKLCWNDLRLKFCMHVDGILTSRKKYFGPFSKQIFNNISINNMHTSMQYTFFK